jgi:hypothetical protein
MTIFGREKKKTVPKDGKREKKAPKKSLNSQR